MEVFQQVGSRCRQYGLRSPSLWITLAAFPLAEPRHAINSG